MYKLKEHLREKAVSTGLAVRFGISRVVCRFISSWALYSTDFDTMSSLY